MHATESQAELPPPIAQPIAAALDRGATVITSNHRAARSLRHSFDLRNRREGRTLWQPANALPWDAWASGLWQQMLVEGTATQLLLSRSQEHAIWRSILAADRERSESLQSTDSLAELAADAWRLLARHNGLPRLRGAWPSAETKALQRWSAEFEQRCRTQGLLPRARLEATLQEVIEAGQLRLSAPLALTGFDDFTPAQRSLIEAIKITGSEVEELRTEIASEEKTLVQAANEIEEIHAAARWAKERLLQHPGAQIAIIVPALDGRRGAIDRIFREVLAPELEDIQASHDAPYEFSLGVPLSETPIVRVALELLRWTLAPLPVERISRLLVSPLFAMREEERSARATFDAFELRRARLLLPEISLKWLSTTLHRSRSAAPPIHLRRTLDAMLRVVDGIRAERQPRSAWAEWIRELLEEARWGRESGDDSIEFQTRQKWESTLDDLAALDFDGSRVTLQQALRELERLAQQTMFAPESHNAPVQVMGPLEAAGSRFDALWFLGAGDLGWPIKSSPSALLPWAMQRDLGVPGADATADDARARRITERLAASAPDIIFSYAAESSDGAQRPSPLLHALHLETPPIAQVAPQEQEKEVVALEEIHDTTSIPPLPVHVIAGGSEILKLQAACGFRAFAERRLGSAELREIELGMDAAERGSVLHRVLEHFWKQTGSQAALKAMSREERNTMLAQSIEEGLRKASALAEGAWEKAYLDLQRARLWALLDPWLDLELNRPPFTVERTEEELKDVVIGPLHLTVRVDRVDATEEGEVILDYKTGVAKSPQWLGERPDEPQLPLYAVLTSTDEGETALTDLAFAQIRAGKEMALDSFSERRPSKKYPKLSLEEQLAEWRRVLTQLATDFHNGAATVAPKNYPTTCAHCAQRILCRLNPAAFDEEFDEETIDAANG